MTEQLFLGSPVIRVWRAKPGEIARYSASVCLKPVRQVCPDQPKPAIDTSHDFMVYG